LVDYTFGESWSVSHFFSSCVAINVHAVWPLLRKHNVHEALRWFELLLRLAVLVDLGKSYASPAALRLDIVEERL
jgi:hypothetical protein